MFCFQSTTEKWEALSIIKELYYDNIAQIYLFLIFYLINNWILKLRIH